MASGAKLLKRMARSKSGWSASDFRRVLEHFGYEFQRHANHGFLYRHEELAEEHPDKEVRMEHAYVLIPRGNELREYVTEEVIASIQALMAFRKEREDV